MDNIFNNSECDGLNEVSVNVDKTVTDDKVDIKNVSQSSTFKIANHRTNPIQSSSRSCYSESSDYDLPSYQINQSVTKCRTASTTEQESNEIVLPFSPVFSPVAISLQKFRPPTIHSLGSVAKKSNRDTAFNNFTKIKKPEVDALNKSQTQSSVFDKLLMTDKDISWASSMASPPPAEVPIGDFNTIEKATFFPEEKFQKIQPRALFSPNSEDSFGFSPLPVSSESEAEDTYKTNARLSDVCATLRELEFGTLKKELNESYKNESPERKPLSCITKTYPTSPVFIIKPKKVVLPRKKDSLVTVIRSPESVYGSEFLSCKVTEKQNFCDKENNSETNCNSDQNSTIKQDESFLDLSFTEIDNMCKTLINSKNKTDSLIESEDLSDMVLLKNQKAINLDKFHSTSIVKKHFYISELSTEVEHTEKYFTSYDEIHNTKYKLLNRQVGQKIMKSHNNNIDNSFWSECNSFLIENNKKQLDFKVVRKSQEANIEICKKENKKVPFNKLDKCISEIDSSLHNKKVTHVAILEEEEKMLEAVEEAEKTLAEEAEMVKAANEMENTSIVNTNEGSSFLKESGISFIGSEKLFTTDCAENVILQPSNKIALNPNNELKIFKNQIEKEDVSFSTAAGLKLSVSEKSLNKARAFLDECERDITLHSIGAPKNCSTPNSFTTRFSRAQKDETFKIEKPKKLTENLDIRFTTCLGQEVNFSENALEKVKFLMGSCSENQLEGSPAKETLSTQAEKLNKFKEQKYNAPAFCGFSTASGIKVSVSEKSLNKAKKLIAECDKEQETMGSLNRTENSFSSDLVRTSTPKITTNESTKEPCRFNKSDDVSENSFKKDICKEMRVANEVQDKEKKSKADETFITNFAKDSISCKNSRFSANKDFNFKTVPDTEESISRRNSPDKPKTLIANCEENELLQNYCQSDGVASCTRNKLSFVDNFTIGFSTGSGKRIEITNEALERARKLMSSCDEILEESNTSGKAGFEFIVPLPKEGGVEACDSVICDTAVSKCQETNYVSGNQNSSCSFFGVEENSVNSESAGSQITVPDKYKDTVVSESKLKLAVSAIKKNGFSKEIETNFFEISENEKGLISEPVHNIVLTHPDDNTQEKIKRKLLYEDQSNTQMKKQIRIFSPPFKDSCRKTGIKRVFKDASLPSKRMKYLNVEEILDGQDENTLGLKDKKSLARLNQEKIIKEKQKVKPLMGSLLMKKSAKQISFREAVGNSSPEDYFKDDNCLKICDASAFKFSGSALFGSDFFDHRIGLNLDDHFVIIPDDKNNFGVEEFKRAFLAGPGVQPNLVPEGWVENHYKWIVWKLSHYEKGFPYYFHGKALTPNNVMLQLKYRYDREIDRNERSALKKILEKDDTSVKKMVLRVCEIKKVKNNNAIDYELSLTDGWYSCPCKVDSAMIKLIDAKKISVGMKLVTQGAILVNCDQGIPPLEITEDVHLKIFTNSTRRIRWDAKLGFQKNPGNLTISLDSALPGGGPISRVDVIIVRVYPLLYLEKTSDGRRIVRNRRAEEKADSEHKRLLEQILEKICSEVQYEMTAKGSKKADDVLVSDLEHVTHSSTKINSDLSTLWAHQNGFSKEINQKIEDRLRKENLNCKRNVTEFLKVKIVDLRKPNYINPTVLSIWGPDEDVINLFSEGKSLALMNTIISPSNFSRAGNFRQINATRQTRFKEINRINEYPTRHLTPLEKISFRVAPIFEEIDLVGIVFLVEEESYSVKNSQLIYLADSNFNFAGLSLLDNYKDYGWKNLLVRRRVIACSNLMWKPFPKNAGVPILQVCETSMFTENPKTDHLKIGIEKLKKNLPKDLEDFLLKCEEKFESILEASKRQDEFNSNGECEQSIAQAVHSEEREKNLGISKPTGSSETISTSSLDSKSREIEKPQKLGKSLQSSFRWLPYKKV